MERILIDDLKEVRALIADVDNWAQGIRHRCNNDGTVSRCILGAIEDVTDEHVEGPTITALFREVHAPNSLPVDHFNRPFEEHERGWEMAVLARFNNTQTHADVIALIDKAIATASGAVMEEKPAEIPANLMRF